MFCPASRGRRKKIAYTMMLTTISRKTVAISRRTMNVITMLRRWCPAWPAGKQSRPGTSILTFSLIYFTPSTA